MSLFIFTALFFLPRLGTAATETAAATFTPWSGYWWPTTEGGLATGKGYRKHPAPLEKYELYRDGYYPGAATQFYLDHNYDPDAPGWYGLCHAWAAAAVYEHLDFKPASIDNIIFHVGDKKGLLTACHETDLSIRENPHTPDIFHFWLLKHIKDEGVGFYAELDPGEQVWNYPVYKYEMTTLEFSGSMAVTCKIWYADDQVVPDYQGTQYRIKTYTYTLYKNGQEITGGIWTNLSEEDHPQQLVLPVSPGTPNSFLDYAMIRKIAATNDDDLESDNAVEITPGGYNLILLNADRYTIDCHAQDDVKLVLEKIDDMEEPLTVTVTDATGQTVYSASVSESTRISFSAAAPPYLLQVSRQAYGEGGIYRLDFDLHKAYEFANIKVQKGFGWGGYAITNTGESACEKVYVVGYRIDNRPVQTYIGPFELPAGQKKVFFLSDFNIRNIEKDDLFGVKILADSPLNVINLTGYYERNMSCTGSGDDSPGRLIIPDSSSPWNSTKKVSWGISNADDRDAAVTFQLYSSGGELTDALEARIPANEALYFSNSDSPFSENVDNGWILISGDTEQYRLKGEVEWLISGIRKAEILPPLKEGTEFIVPHAIADGFWRMQLTLINTSDTENQVEFTLLNGEALSRGLLTMRAKEKKTLSIEDIFTDADRVSIDASGVSIRSASPMAGYFSFESPADDVYYPLLDAALARSQLILPHVAESDYWWTALNLFNDNGVPVDIRLMPYDQEGNLMEFQLTDLRIDAYAKAVFTVASRFGALAPDIGYLKIVAPEGKPVYGIFGIGNRDCSMLSGGVLQ